MTKEGAFLGFSFVTRNFYHHLASQNVTISGHFATIRGRDDRGYCHKRGMLSLSVVSVTDRKR